MTKPTALDEEIEATHIQTAKLRLFEQDICELN